MFHTYKPLFVVCMGILTFFDLLGRIKSNSATSHTGDYISLSVHINSVHCNRIVTIDFVYLAFFLVIPLFIVHILRFHRLFCIQFNKFVLWVEFSLAPTIKVNLCFCYLHASIICTVLILSGAKLVCVCVCVYNS